jgi:DNA modification methylase
MELQDLINRIHQGDSRKFLKEVPDGSVNCCVTSPPYYGLRDYGTGKWEGGDITCDHRFKQAEMDSTSTLKGSNERDGFALNVYKDVCRKCGAARIDEQMGLESTPEEYVIEMVKVFDQVKRVLKDDGTLWLIVGDSYNGSGKAGNNPEYQKKHTAFGKLEKKERFGKPVNVAGLKPKDLIGIPWMLAFALRSSGWYLRSDIIWHKHPCMPESVEDRPTKSHEYVFLLAKSEQYYYDVDAIREPLSFNRWSKGNVNGSGAKGFKHHNGSPGQKPHSFHRNGHSGYYDNNGKALFNEKGKNKRTVWTVQPAQFPEAHFATFPELLIEPCIQAGCPEGGIVLDPFAGAGTCPIVAKKLNRNFIAVELNPEYIELSENRLRKEIGLFL